jgi:hypothetical protein
VLVPPGIKPAVPEPPFPSPAKIILLAKTEGSLNPDPTDVEVELAGKSQPIKRRLVWANELEHIPKEMIANKTEKNRRLPTIRYILSKVSDFARA